MEGGLLQSAIKLVSPELARGGPCPKHLPELPPVSQMSPLVWRVLGQNPGVYTLQGTNTYLVGSGNDRILVDAGEGCDGYTEALREAMLRSGAQRIHAIVITHHHSDHVGGVADVMREFDVKRVLKMPLPSADGAKLTKLLTGELKHGDVVSVEGATLRAIHAPGHTQEHLCYMLEEEGTLFAGDVVLGGSTPVFEDLAQYVASLKLLKRECERARMLGCTTRAGRMYPSHGDEVADGPEEVDGYLMNRAYREYMVLDALLKAGDGATTWDITESVYSDMPIANKLAAQHLILSHLKRLASAGGVEPQRTVKGTFRRIAGIDRGHGDIWRLTPKGAAVAMRDFEYNGDFPMHVPGERAADLPTMLETLARPPDAPSTPDGTDAK